MNAGDEEGKHLASCQLRRPAFTLRARKGLKSESDTEEASGSNVENEWDGG